MLSILAGTTLKTLHEALPGIDLVRVMPNLGAQLRQAVLCVVFPRRRTTPGGSGSPSCSAWSAR